MPDPRAQRCVLNRTLARQALAEGLGTAFLLVAVAVVVVGLLLVVFGVARSGRRAVAPFAVGAYITAAYFFTSSTSFANPAVTLARTLTDSFSGIEPGSVPGFLSGQVVGAVLAVGAIAILYPRARDVAADLVVPHAPEEARRV